MFSLSFWVVVFTGEVRIGIGHEVGSKVGAVVFAIDSTECVRRVKSRAFHETLHPERDNVEAVVTRIANSLVRPSREEGLDFCRYVRDDEDYRRVFDEVR